MEREVRYCTSADGTRIAYCVYGEGPALVSCPYSWNSFDNDVDEVDVVAPLAQGRTVVRYDFRGVGLSQRGIESFALEKMVEDVEAVTQAAGLDRFSMLASVFSTGPAIAFAARHPTWVSRLVVERVITRGTDVMPRENLDGLLALVSGNWEMASQTLGDLGGNRTLEPTLGIRAAKIIRQNVEPDDLAAMLEDLYESIDILDLLSNVQCPTLIFHGKDDPLFPFSAAQNAAAVIPNARLVTYAPGDYALAFGAQAEEYVQTIVAFLDEDPQSRALSVMPPSAAAPNSAFRAVLFTDLVGHTEMMSRLGDERGRNVLREHERITREVLAANGGTEVKTMGDGFMASFGSVTKAVECAIALQRAMSALTPDPSPAAAGEGQSAFPLKVRVGLNAGEPIEEDGDLFGATVILASRIAAKAEGGEILVADTVRGLCSGKGFLFGDRGEFVAKGFEEPVRVYEVSWRTGV